MIFWVEIPCGVWIFNKYTPEDKSPNEICKFVALLLTFLTILTFKSYTSTAWMVWNSFAIVNKSFTGFGETMNFLVAKSSVDNVDVSAKVSNPKETVPACIGEKWWKPK